MRFSSVFTIPAAILILTSATMEAHDYWLEPENMKVNPGAEVKIHFMFGKDFAQGEDKALQLNRTPMFKCYGALGRPLNLLKNASPEQIPAGKITVGKRGNLVIAMERNASVTRFGRAKFLDFVASEGHSISESDLSIERRTVFEKHSRYFKSLIQIGDVISGNDTKRVGLKFEIVPMTSPFDLTKPRVDFRVFFEGKPCPNLLVTGLNMKKGVLTRVTARTNAKGKCTLPITREGKWLVRSVRIEAESLTTANAANYQSHWASLTFGY